jgi:signal transduction histidine kinase/CheY-like chemotaxis protein
MRSFHDFSGGKQDFPRRVAQLACGILGARHVGIGLTSVDGQLIELAKAPSAPDATLEESSPGHTELITLLQYVLNTGDCVRMPGLDLCGPDSRPIGVGPFLGVRLYYSGQCGGVMYFARAPGDPAFTPEDEEQARAFRRFLEQQDLAEESSLLIRVRLLNQIAQAASTGADLQKTLRVALSELVRHLPMSLCAVWLRDEGAEELVLASTSDPPLAGWKPGRLQPGLRLTLTESPFRSCFTDCQTWYYDQLATSPSSWLQEWARQGAVACLAVPLRCGQQPVGLLQSLCTRPAGFALGQIQLICMVADLLGPAISNFQLYDRLDRAYQQLQAAQQQLINAEKMRALGELASGMAHDFNNALCGTLGFVELALKDESTPVATRDLLQMAKTCAVDAAATVRRVQDFARWERGIREGQTLDPNELARNTANLTRHKWQDLPHARGNPIDFEIVTEAKATVHGNPSELREVLTNLLFNAVDAMPQGGKLTLRTSSTPAAVFINVIDTGIGMPKEVQQRLFEPFFSTKKERGTGLGLSVSYAIIKRHGGQIHVTSEVGKGSTFTIRLPVAQGVAAGKTESAPAMPNGLRILVIDDEPTVLLFLGRSLNRLGHRAETASNGLEGIQRFEAQKFDLVITDLGMPAMSGEEVVRRIRQLSVRVPIILLTGWADQLRAQGETPIGVDLVLGKPLTLEQLSAAIARTCQLRQASG